MHRTSENMYSNSRSPIVIIGIPELHGGFVNFCAVRPERREHRGENKISYISPIVISIVVVDVLLGGSGRVPVSLLSFHFLENLDAVLSLKSCTQDYD